MSKRASAGERKVPFRLLAIVLVIAATVLVATVGIPSVKNIFGGGGVQKVAVPSFAPITSNESLPPSAGVESAPSEGLGRIPLPTEVPQTIAPPLQSVPSQAGAVLEKGAGVIKEVSNTSFMNTLAHELGKFGYEPSRAGSALTDISAKILAFIIWVGILWALLSLCNIIFLSRMEFPISSWLKWALALSTAFSLRLPVFSSNVTLPVLQATGTSEILGMFKTASFISKFWILSAVLAAILSVGYIAGLVIHKPVDHAKAGVKSLVGRVSNGNGTSIQIVWVIPTMIGILSLGAFLWDKWRKPTFLGISSADAANLAPIFLLLCAVFMIGSYATKYIKPSVVEAVKMPKTGGSSVLFHLLSTTVNNVLVLVEPLIILCVMLLAGSLYLINAFPETFFPVIQGIPLVGKVVSGSANAMFFYKLLTAIIIIAGGIERMWETSEEKGWRRPRAGFPGGE